MDMNKELKKIQKYNFKNDFLKLLKNVFFGKTMGNMRNHRDIKLVTTEARRNYSVSEPKYHTTSFFCENLLVTDMKKTTTNIYEKTSLSIGLLILEISKTVMYEFFHDYVELKYGVKVKLCYMNTYSFIVYIKTEDIYSDIVKDVETRFKTSIYELDRPLPKGKNKVIDLIKNELGGTIMKESVALRAKTCSHLTDNNDEDKKRQKHKKVCRKKKT